MNSSCGREWTRRFINTTFSQSFIQKDWKTSREKLAFDRETALLPASEEVLERRLHLENVHKEINFTKLLIKNAEKFYIKEFREKKIKYTYENAPLELLQLREKLEDLYQSIHVRPATRNSQAPTRHFVRGCPAEECRGFLSSDWKCGLCKVESCSKCHLIKNNTDEHTCNPDDVATATLLNKDTKPCPKCHTGIFKIDGCDQMWCTQCHTAFSWRTGDIETKIHNPHYYEWQRRNNGGVAPRVAGDGPLCGQDQPLNQYIFRHITGLQLRLDITLLSGNIIRDIIHLREVILPEYRPANRHDDNIFLENRIRYLKKDITKENFIGRVLKENKKREIHTEIRDVLQMFVQASTDIIYRFLALAQNNRDENESDRLKMKLGEVETLRKFTNEALKEIYTTYKYTEREISFMNEELDRARFNNRNVFNIVEKKIK